MYSRAQSVLHIGEHSPWLHLSIGAYARADLPPSCLSQKTLSAPALSSLKHML